MNLFFDDGDNTTFTTKYFSRAFYCCCNNDCFYCVLFRVSKLGLEGQVGLSRSSRSFYCSEEGASKRAGTTSILRTKAMTVLPVVAHQITPMRT